MRTVSFASLPLLVLSCSDPPPAPIAPHDAHASHAVVATTSVVEVRVAASRDDAEERGGRMDLTSSDLELVFGDGSNQTVGMRFNGVTIPPRAKITRAYVQFQVDETSTNAASLAIRGQATDYALTFSSTSRDITSRSRTVSTVSWSPPPWTTVGQAGADQQTPDLASIIQEIVNRPGWHSGNSLALIITGTGWRTAEAYNGVPSAAPLLHVEYSSEDPPPPPPGTPDRLNCTGYPEPRIFLESQAWWSKTGLKIPGTVSHEPGTPYDVGEHIHVGLCWPVGPTGNEHFVSPSNQQMHFDVRVIVHNTQVATHLVRVLEEGVVKIRPDFKLGPGNAEGWMPFDIDFSTWSTGRRELRWTSRIMRPDPTDQSVIEMLNSTGWQMCIRSCTPSYRPLGLGDPQDPTAPFTEARGYYSGHDYDNVQFLSPLPINPVSGDWTFLARQVSTGPGGIFIDPDFHNGKPGIVVKPTGGSWKGNITIDTRTLTNGKHKLVLIASDGNNGGVQVVTFVVQN